LKNFSDRSENVGKLHPTFLPSTIYDRESAQLSPISPENRQFQVDTFHDHRLSHICTPGRLSGHYCSAITSNFRFVNLHCNSTRKTSDQTIQNAEIAH
jgi:hypothetical protein